MKKKSSSKAKAEPKQQMGSLICNDQPKIFVKDRIIHSANSVMGDLTMIELFRWVNEEFQQVVVFQLHHLETDRFVTGDDGALLYSTHLTALLDIGSQIIEIELEDL